MKLNKNSNCLQQLCIIYNIHSRSYRSERVCLYYLPIAEIQRAFSKTVRRNKYIGLLEYTHLEIQSDTLISCEDDLYCRYFYSLDMKPMKLAFTTYFISVVFI